MSDERRKRQEERDGSASNGKTKKVATYVVVGILLAAAWIAGQYYQNHKYDAFAKCLAAKHVKMYGLSWCSHCADQKEKFRGAFQYVPYQECGINATKEETPECKAAGLTLFPSWQFGDEPPKADIFSLEALSDKTGCSLP
jgi:hypothetical protein